MPWAYALPIALGVVTVVAVTVILVEVVPAFLEDLERDRRDRERRRIAGQRRMASVQAVPQGAGTAAEMQQGTHGYKRYEIHLPTRDSPQHVLGASEFENDNEVPLAQMPGRATPAAATSELTGAKQTPEDSSEAAAEVSTSASGPIPTATDAPAPSVAANEFLFVPNESTDSDDPFTDAQASSLATSSSSLPLSKSATLEPSSPTSDTAPLPDLLTSESDDAGWVIPSTSPSLAGGSGSDEDGWSRLSDEEDDFTSVSGAGAEPNGATEEWAQVHGSAAL
ncbi:hypothetical protein Rt10032_c07g3024 [Rhodotorula toruloides]|uniref:Uncharacterized protein n=1 Tax=Rhodotorula toruloides TaxID=5286 RepID=A0A511KF50_RHOTO|nr:hypothetical protein Rt10032_c07g3024 [Rhodotorula toruloides]